MQWPYENATRGEVGPSPQRHPWSQWSRLLNFGRAFEVCLSETWQRLQATGQRRQELMFKLGLHLWIGMDNFFLVQLTMIFLFYTVRSNSFTWPLPRFKEKVQFCILHRFTTQRNKKRNDIPQPTTVYFLPLFKQFSVCNFNHNSRSRNKNIFLLV